MKESLKKAQENYRKKCRIYQFRVNRETEADIAEWLDKGDTARRLKVLIRQDINKNPSE